MVALTQNEILDQLKILGINSEGELKTYSCDYISYYSNEYLFHGL